MIVRQCDRCKQVIAGDGSDGVPCIPEPLVDKWKRSEVKMSVEIANGDLCLHCLIDVLHQYDNRPTEK